MGEGSQAGPVERSQAGPVERGVHFVARHGTGFEPLFAAALAGGPREPASARLARGQAEDGGFAGANLAERMRATEAALDALVALGQSEGQRFERGAGWLAQVQQSDGSFAGDLLVTAAVAGTLARSACARPALLARAIDHIDARFTPDLAETAPPELLLRLAVAYALLPCEGADEALQWLGRALEKGFRGGTLAPEQVALGFARAGAHAFPATSLGAPELHGSLLAGQCADGGWPGADAAARVAATLAALRGLVHIQPATKSAP